MDNKQLPAEVLEEIRLKADKQLIRTGNTSYNRGYRDGEVKGATEYATKLHELQQKYDNILATESGYESKTENVWQSGYASGHEAATAKAQQEIESLTDQLKAHAGVSNENMKLLRQENEKARALLEKVISRHEAGLLPDRFIYQEIKTFLDGK